MKPQGIAAPPVFRVPLRASPPYLGPHEKRVRATVYGTVTPSSLSVRVPGTLSGPLTVRAAAYINGSVRSFTFMDLITEI